MRGSFLGLKFPLVNFILLGTATFAAAQSVPVPEPVAYLVRPILDSQQERSAELSKQLVQLTKLNREAADEALVVLTCFYIGESQEEADAIIARGKRMLPLLQKYRMGPPVIPHRSYPASMLREDKQEHFNGLIRAIKHGWRGTWDNPQG